MVNNWHLVRAALQLAIDLHHGQKRKSGGPYIYHPIRIAQRLWSLGICDEFILAAALLHDVLEDCQERLDKKMLGRFYALDPRVVFLVEVLTKNRPHNADQYYGRISTNTVASVIKLADRADNLATMNGAFAEERARKYIEETKCYILPLTAPNRNGNGHWRPAFDTLHREIRALTRKAEQDFNLRNGCAKHTKCPARNRTDLEVQRSGAPYLPLARSRTSASSTPYGSPTAP